MAICISSVEPISREAYWSAIFCHEGESVTAGDSTHDRGVPPPVSRILSQTLPRLLSDFTQAPNR